MVAGSLSSTSIRCDKAKLPTRILDGIGFALHTPQQIRHDGKLPCLIETIMLVHLLHTRSYSAGLDIRYVTEVS